MSIPHILFEDKMYLPDFTDWHEWRVESTNFIIYNAFYMFY